MPRPIPAPVERRDVQARATYKLAEVARMLGVDPKTIYRWLAKGILREVPVPGGKRLVDARSVEKFIAGKPKNTRQGQALGQRLKDCT